MRVDDVAGKVGPTCLTAMGPTGNHWLGPLARMNTSYTKLPSSRALHSSNFQLNASRFGHTSPCAPV
jgi:hypothetical protein